MADYHRRENVIKFKIYFTDEVRSRLMSVTKPQQNVFLGNRTINKFKIQIITTKNIKKNRSQMKTKMK